MQVLELLKESGDDSFDTMLLLQTLGQVKTDVVDGKLTEKDRKISSTNNGDAEMKGVVLFIRHMQNNATGYEVHWCSLDAGLFFN